MRAAVDILACIGYSYHCPESCPHRAGATFIRLIHARNMLIDKPSVLGVSAQVGGDGGWYSAKVQTLHTDGTVRSLPTCARSQLSCSAALAPSCQRTTTAQDTGASNLLCLLCL